MEFVISLLKKLKSATTKAWRFIKEAIISEDTSTAYFEGFDAYRSNSSAHLENPYRPGSEEYASFNLGWRSARNEVTDCQNTENQDAP